MYNSDTEMIFPSRVIPGLRDFRGEPWQQLVDVVSQKAPESLECTGFVLMMARINACVFLQYGFFPGDARLHAVRPPIDPPVPRQ